MGPLSSQAWQSMCLKYHPDKQPAGEGSQCFLFDSENSGSKMQSRNSVIFLQMHTATRFTALLASSNSSTLLSCPNLISFPQLSLARPGWVLQWSGPAGPRRYGPCGGGPREPAWARRAREPAEPAEPGTE